MSFLLVFSSCLQEGQIGPQGDSLESYPDGYFRIVSTGLHTATGVPYSVNMELKNCYSELAQGYMERTNDTTLGFHFNRYLGGERGDAYVSIYTDTSAGTVTNVSLTVLFDHTLEARTKTSYRADGLLPGPSTTGDTLRFQRFVYDKTAHRIQGEFTLSRPGSVGTSPAVLTCTFDCLARPIIQ